METTHYIVMGRSKRGTRDGVIDGEPETILANELRKSDTILVGFNLTNDIVIVTEESTDKRQRQQQLGQTID